MTKTALQFEEVSFGFPGEAELFNHIQLHINAGEFVSIIGASGSGKSTLFKLTVGLEEPSGGVIKLGGEKTSRRLGSVGYMPQQDLLLPWRTVMDNAALPLELKGQKKEEARRQVQSLLDEFGLKGSEEKFPSQLSGGMKQRVSFLRAVLSGSPLLLLDEPFSALDAITKMALQEWLLKRWESRDLTIVFITHDVDEALFLSDRVYVLIEKPVKYLKEVKVPLGRPRTIEDLYSPLLVEKKRVLLNELRPMIE
jgi:putative hydroxymethylpyrimidine transport system ATP-binding protein